MAIIPSIPFVAYHPEYTLQLPEKHRVPIDKYTLLPQQLLYRGIIEEKDIFSPEPASPSFLTPVHTPDYLNRALRLQLTGKEARRIGYPYNDALIRRELRIVQGTLTGAEIALQTGFAFSVAGGTHHAGSYWGEGFCLFNDVAAAAYHLLNRHQINRILIVDLDVHQGNGTAEIFQNENRVFTFSIHGEKNFPFRKEKSDLDIGLADGVRGDQYLTVLEENLIRIFEQFHPEFVFYLAGADVLHTDKLGRFNLTKEDCRRRDQLVFQFCKSFQIPVHVGTAGGYAKQVKDTVDVHSQTLEEGINTILY